VTTDRNPVEMMATLEGIATVLTAALEAPRNDLRYATLEYSCREALADATSALAAYAAMPKEPTPEQRVQELEAALRDAWAYLDPMTDTGERVRKVLGIKCEHLWADNRCLCCGEKGSWK